MKKYIFYILLLSISGNVYFLYDKFVLSVPNPSPVWHPFDFNINMTYDAMIEDGYEWVPEDVPILGKTVDSITIYYQFSFFSDFDDYNTNIPMYEENYEEPNYSNIELYSRYFRMEISNLNLDKVIEYIEKHGGFIHIDDLKNIEDKSNFKVSWNPNGMTYNCSIHKKPYSNNWFFEINCQIPTLKRENIERNIQIFNEFENIE